MMVFVKRGVVYCYFLTALLLSVANVASAAEATVDSKMSEAALLKEQEGEDAKKQRGIYYACHYGNFAKNRATFN